MNLGIVKSAGDHVQTYFKQLINSADSIVWRAT